MKHIDSIETRAASTRPTPADARDAACYPRLLLLDRRRSLATAHLRGWLGRDGAARLLRAADPRHRYVLIQTLDTGGNPRYLHSINLLVGLDDLTAALLDLVRDAEGTAPPGGVTHIDVGFSLEPGERDLINTALDEHCANRLLRAPAGGRA